MSDETPAPTPEAAPAPETAQAASPPEAAQPIEAQPITPAPTPPSPISGLSFEQAIALAERLAAAQRPAPAPAAPVVPQEVTLLQRFETDQASRAEVVRQMMQGGDPTNPAHVAVVHQALRAEAAKAELAGKFSALESQFQAMQRDAQQAALAQRVDSLFDAKVSQYAAIDPAMQNLLASNTALLIRGGYTPEQAIAQTFQSAAPLLRLKGAPGRPTAAQAGIAGNAAAKAAVAVAPNGAGRLAPNTNDMAKLDRDGRKAALAAARKSIFQS